MDDPEVRKAMKSGAERMITNAYGPLFQKLGLDEQTSKLAADIIGERNMAAMDKGRKLMEAGITEANAAGVRQEINAVKTEYDGKLRSVLGEQGYSEFSSFEQTVGDQRSLDSSRATLSAKACHFSSRRWTP
jgi:hypothetical protein